RWRNGGGARYGGDPRRAVGRSVRGVAAQSGDVRAQGRRDAGQPDLRGRRGAGARCLGGGPPCGPGRTAYGPRRHHRRLSDLYLWLAGADVTERQAGSTTPKAHLIAAEVRRRIVEREWLQGERIPDEVELAVEFGAARATVNKALQLLADEGLLDRRRRAGTRIAINPVRKATFEIPIVREQIEGAGMSYGHRVMAVHRSPLPEDVALRLGMAAGQRLLHLRAVHYGDGRPFQYEDRWINPAALPGTEPVDFGHVN